MIASAVDLHMHSTASDGSDAPEAVAALAERNGLRVIALTDHDSLDGIPAAAARAEAAGIRLIPGVELSVYEEGTDVHLLAYGFDPADGALRAAIARYRESRRERARKILARLKGLGIRVPMEEVETIARGGALGRPHVAEALLRAGHVDSFNEAFQRFLGTHAPAYVGKTAVSLEEATRVVREAGGVTVLAHPGTLNRDHLIPGLRQTGPVPVRCVWVVGDRGGDQIPPWPGPVIVHAGLPRWLRRSACRSGTRWRHGHGPRCAPRR